MSLNTESVDKASLPDSISPTSSTAGGAASAELVQARAAPPPHRFTEPQRVYLKGRIPDFRRAQLDKSWDETWASIHGGFVEEWPHGPLTAAQVAAGIGKEDVVLLERKVNCQLVNG